MPGDLLSDGLRYGCLFCLPLSSTKYRYVVSAFSFFTPYYRVCLKTQHGNSERVFSNACFACTSARLLRVIPLRFVSGLGFCDALGRV